MLLITLAEEVGISGVSYQLLSMVSMCARGLPAGAAEWDLSKMQIEGQPVQRKTVLQWLQKAYQHVYGDPFVDPLSEAAQPGSSSPAGPPAQDEQQDRQDSATAEQAGPTFTELTELLLFADAVGCTPPLLRACASELEQLRLCVQLPAGPQCLQVSKPYFWDSTTIADTHGLCVLSAQQSGNILVQRYGCSRSTKHHVSTAVTGTAAAGSSDVCCLQTAAFRAYRSFAQIHQHAGSVWELYTVWQAAPHHVSTGHACSCRIQQSAGDSPVGRMGNTAHLLHAAAEPFQPELPCADSSQPFSRAAAAHEVQCRVSAGPIWQHEGSACRV